MQNCLSRSLKCVLAVLSLAALVGCANPFRQFYGGTTATVVNEKEKVVVVSESPAVVLTSANISADLDARLQDGLVVLGEANWSGPNIGSESQAQEQAKLVGASLVLWSWKHAGSTSGVMPLTVPTTTTTYGGGSVYGTYGSATWTGTATTYGTRTTYIPYTVHRYEVASVFLAAPATKPVLGVRRRPPTPQEQAEAGTVGGLVVLIVIRGSPAAKAGILPGDTLCKIGGDSIDSEQEFDAALKEHQGRTVEIEIRRKGQRVMLTAALGSR